MSNALRRAIKLKQWIRQAVAKNDLDAILDLNRLLDKQLKNFSAKEEKIYRKWAELSPAKAKEFWDQVEKSFKDPK